MKFIKKYQQGSGFTVYSPTWTGSVGVANTASGSGAAAPTKENNSIISEDLYKEIIKSGGDVLPNEWTSLTAKIQALASVSQLPYLQEDILMQTLEATGELNHLKRNKKMWDEAYATAKSNNSLNEIAINDSGAVYVKDRNGKVSTISMSDYSKRKDRVEALTISDLLEHRQYDGNFIHNTTAFNVANNAVSIDNIHKYIDGIVSTLGKETSEYTTTVSREDGINKVNLLRQLSQNGRTPSSEELKGLEVLNHIANSPEEAEQILKYVPGDNIEIDKKIETQRNHAVKAAKYIWTTLDKQSQNRLKIQSIENNIDSPIDFIVDMIAIGTDHYVSEKYTPKKSVDSSSNAEKLTGYENLNNPQMMLKGTINTDDYIFNTIDEDSKRVNGLLRASMAGKTSLVTPSGEAIRETTFDNFLGTGWSEVIDQESVYFGEQSLPAYDFEEVALLQGNDLAKVYLPATKDDRGRVKPDFESLETFNSLMTEYKKDKDNMNRSDIINHFRREGFNVELDQDNEIIGAKLNAGTSAVVPFLITTAYTRKGAEILQDNINDNSLWKLTGSESKSNKDRLERAYTDISKGSKKDKGPKGWLGGKTPYKGIIYMPLRESAEARLSAIPKIGKGPKEAPVTAATVNIQSRQSSNVGFSPTSRSELEQ